MQLVDLLEIKDQIEGIENGPIKSKSIKKGERQNLQKNELGGSVIFGDSSQKNVNFLLYFFKVGTPLVEKWNKEVSKRLINLPLEKKDIAQYLRNMVTVHGCDESCKNNIYKYI